MQNAAKTPVLVPILGVFLFAGAAQAQTHDLPDPGMLPDSPVYFLKSMSEGIGTFFTFGDAAKAERFLELSEKRLAEARALADRGKPEAAERAIERYEEQLERALLRAEEARAKGQDTDEVLARMSKATLRHQAVLAEVHEKVPEQARPAIQRAMHAGMRGHEEAMAGVSREKREEVLRDDEGTRRDAHQRLEELRARGVPVPAVPTREEIERRASDRPERGRPGAPDRPGADRPGAPDRPQPPGRPPPRDRDQDDDGEPAEAPERP